MKRTALRLGCKVDHDPTARRIHLRLGHDLWMMSAGEAVILANQLVDHAEALYLIPGLPQGAHPPSAAKRGEGTGDGRRPPERRS